MAFEFQTAFETNLAPNMWDEYRRIVEGRREFTGSQANTVHPVRPIENLALNYDIGGRQTGVSRYSTFGEDEFLGGETFGSVTGEPSTVKGIYTPSKDTIALNRQATQFTPNWSPGDPVMTPGELEIHEVRHKGEKILRENSDYWKDITVATPSGNVKLIDVIMPNGVWDRRLAHAANYSAAKGYTPLDPDKYADISPGLAQSVANALDAAANKIQMAMDDGSFVYGSGPFPSVSPEQHGGEPQGLLMSNEAWVQRVMGEGAEEERKTEVSKQKVEAKRQAQVAEVKKEKTKPSSVREAKARGELYFYDSKGKKKLALTAEDVKKFKASDKYDPEGKSTLTQMANIGEKEGIEGLLTTAAPKPKDVEVPKAEKKGYNFRNNWEKYYYAGKPKGEKYMEGFQERLSSKKAIPDKAKEAIEIAVDIFGGDKDKNGKRYSADRLRKDLQNIGRVESQYRKKESIVGGTEKGWWQVKPSTAKDALKNAKKHFGKKFNKHFKKYGGYDGLWDRAQKGTLSALMLKDEQLAAAFAAVQVIRTFDQE
jgi:hypothetical protein